MAQYGVTGRRIHDDDAVIGSGFDIDIINTYTGTADHLQILGDGNNCGIEFGVGSHRDGVDVLGKLKDLFRGGTIGFYNVKAFLSFEQVNTYGRYAVCN